MHGWIILDKPLGLGSTQGVSAVKRALRDGGYGKWKVGHGGTLDPLATGVLPIAVGEATKLAGRMLDGDKAYLFTIRFGEQTDTLDAEGEVVVTSPLRPAATDAVAVLSRFEGVIDQAPPAFSAIKIDGERAYARARSGEDVVMAMRRVTVHRLARYRKSALGIWARSGRYDPDAEPGARADGDEAPLKELTLFAHVSKGTYIRSLARDIALALGTVGHVTYLRRIKAGPFDLSHAISLDKLADAAKGRTLEDNLLPLRAGLDDIPALSLTPDQAGLLRQGRVLVGIAADDGQRFALLDDVPVALVEVQAGEVRVIRGFNL